MFSSLLRNEFVSASNKSFFHTPKNSKYILRLIPNTPKIQGDNCPRSFSSLRMSPNYVLQREPIATPILDNSSRNLYTYPCISKKDEKCIIKSPYSDTEIPERNLADHVWEDVEKRTEDVALVCGLTGRQYTYGMAYDISKKFGSALRRMGAQKGDCVALLVPNIPEFPIVFLGAVGVGLPVTTINCTYTANEIANQMYISNAKYIVTVNHFLNTVKEASNKYDKIKETIVIGQEDLSPDCISFMSMVISEDGSFYNNNDRQCLPHEDLAVIPFSSGTTGPAKGVCLTHYNMVSNMAQCQHPDLTIMPGGYLDEDQPTTVAILPFSHIYSMNTTMTFGLRIGAKIVTLPQFDPESYLHALQTYKPTWLALVPTLANFLATNPSVTSEHIESINTVTGGGAPFPPQLVRNLKEKWKPNNLSFREGYGMTESSPVTLIQPKHNSIIGSCGHLVPNTWAKVVDIDSGEVLGPNNDGELCVAGPQVMKEYFNNLQATKSTIKDGWLHTGDIAIYNPEGQFFIVDRLKELIKVKGLQVSPTELESLIKEHKGVSDAAVVGIHDDRYGEVPRAFVVKRDENLTEQDITEFINDKVAPHKKLKGGVYFCLTIPKNHVGKVLRRVLKAQILDDSFGEQIVKV